ncbi:Cytochrome c551 peroxidase precursor [Boseongicola aestuarii]|uniref:Cytochrome c551 peroxidase n=2 Tax=Boseongicola aestuarii TaxID=1470561 RepID=A0A238J1K0_9RHOB|nr:Cytochrome c551 peroxidase precursor [Boseongicola aestuarii]
MPLQRRAQVPLERPLRITLNTQSKRIHHADQFLSIRVSRPCRRQEFLHRFFKPARFHKVAGCFDFSPNRACEHGCTCQNKPMNRLFHILALCIALPASAADVPRPLTDDDFIAFDPEKAKIGQLLFYDKILSGNRNISCGTCHHHDLGGSDGLSLGIGEGGEGVGPERHAGTGPDRIEKRIPRNAPALWNLGAKDIDVLFHDGRLSVSDIFGNGFNSPAEEWLPEGLETILAAQALFPLTARFEMAGAPRENEVGGAINDRIDNAWPIITLAVRTNPDYGLMFVKAFDDINKPEDVEIVDIANALAAFMGTEWKNHDSPFDLFLAGDDTALTPAAKNGMELFYGDAGCASCHSSPLMSDQKFHALALPAFGPGKTRRFDLQPRDVGRMGESDRLEDAYRFRTPMLRNVALTAPYGHNGAYPTLEGIVRHHLDPRTALDQWTRDQARLPSVPWLARADFAVQYQHREIARQRAKIDITPRDLSDNDIADLVAFLESLTGKTARNLPLGRPETVPSGLTVD